MQITFLHHSGFLVQDGVRGYVFDDWKDPAGVVAKAQAAGCPLWFFVSHAHGDHFSPAIAQYDSPDTVYIVHADVPFTAQQGRTYRMEVDDSLTVDGVNIHMYGSTDLGGSFLVETAAGSFFHAGDLNWWHWLGESPAENAEARRLWVRELERMRGVSVDYACFPVDRRLNYPEPGRGGAREWGLQEWLSVVTVRRLLIAMHQQDEAEGGWHPSEHIRALYPDVHFWIPRKDGDAYTDER